MFSNRRLVAICAIALTCNVVLMVLFVKYNIDEKCYVAISEHQNVTSVIPDDFLSFGLDASELEKFKAVDFSNLKFRELTAALAPARLRLGGTMSERLIFSKEEVPFVSCDECQSAIHGKHICTLLKKHLCKHKFLPFFIMTGPQWTEINEFCIITGMKPLFSFNVLLRNDHGWSDLNAKEILNYSSSYGYKVDWQLGNEPNSFPHTFNVSISPEQLARDFKKLRHLLNEYGYMDSLLVGPDTTRPQPQKPYCLQYMVDFLSNGSHSINIRSWHQYYLNSRTGKLADFWNPNTFDLLKEQIKTMKNHTFAYGHIPMWLSETSSSYGGGAPGLSNTFAASPLWVDKLGLSAKNNITTVIRQSLYGGNYSLINNDMEPLPDWWVSKLYKTLVGNKVLHVKCKCSRFQRMYAHCTSKNYTNDSSAITVYAVNLEMNKIRFLLNGTALQNNELEIDEYIFSAPSNNRMSKTVLLNSWELYYESPLPPFQPRRLKQCNHISMPPYSIGFWVIKNTTIKVCKR